MNIYGIGTDIVRVDRIKKILKNKSLLKRVFNEKEILKCK
jgi:phosphopantetheinyl transferase (holo-ACP synthase)